MKNNSIDSKQTANIVKFIQNIGEKNYAKANNWLQKAVENKLLNKISDAKNINIFKQ